MAEASMPSFFPTESFCATCVLPIEAEFKCHFPRGALLDSVLPEVTRPVHSRATAAPALHSPVHVWDTPQGNTGTTAAGIWVRGPHAAQAPT